MRAHPTPPEQMDSLRCGIHNSKLFKTFVNANLQVEVKIRDSTVDIFLPSYKKWIEPILLSCNPSFPTPTPFFSASYAFLVLTRRYKRLNTPIPTIQIQIRNHRSRNPSTSTVHNPQGLWHWKENIPFAPKDMIYCSWNLATTTPHIDHKQS